MAKNVLFLVTGGTPQIITETIWALACDPENSEKWVPDEIHVMSTSYGLNEVRNKLLMKEKALEAMKKEFPQLAHLQLEESFLYTFIDGESELADLRTPSENECAADQICKKVRDLAQDGVNLHVSIAGGRKTMGFYAGYALSLYGRVQDRMSHVLVDEKYEKGINFFYPSLNKSDFIVDRDNKTIGLSKDAKVWLADIPFVRMQYAVKDKHQLKGEDSFSQVVNKINESFNDISLKIHLHNRSVLINDKLTIQDLPPREFAMLHWFADRRKKGLDGIIAPKIDANSKKVSAEEAAYLQQLTDEFTPYYEDIKNTNEENGFIVDKKFFESVKSHLKTSLEKSLGLELATKIFITQAYKDGKQQRGTPFYLNVPPDAIEILDKFKD